MTQVQFAQPHWLWIGALCCAIVMALFARARRLGRRALSRLAGSRFVTTASPGRRLAKQAFLVVGIAASFTALARPRWGFRWEEERREGVDLMFAVDTSKSMGATDLRPDRLTRAKLAVSDLLRSFPGERAGLIAFAGDAFVQAPMTIDQAVFAEALDALDTGIIPRGGTDIAAAVRTAVRAMASEPDRRKVLVILSDGEDLQGEVAAAATEAARAGLVIYTVGVGTPAGGLIPVAREGRPDVVRDADGQPVRSRLDEATLRRLAQATGAAYVALGPAGGGLDVLYRQYLSRLPRHAVEERMRKVYTERFQLPLALGIACLLAELAVGERARRRARRTAAGSAPVAGAGTRPVPSPASARSASVVALLSGLLLAAWPGHAAMAAAAPSRPAGAAPTGDLATYNAGTDAYRKKDFAAARERFQGATHTTDVAVQSDAYYDLGNARYRLGQASLPKDRQATIEAWKQAVAAYDGALALHKDDADARFNRDLVARRLKALEDEEHRKQQEEGKQKQPHAGGGPKSASPSSGGKTGNEDKGQQQEQAQNGGQGQQRQGQQGQAQQGQGQQGQAQNPGKNQGGGSPGQAAAAARDAAERDQHAQGPGQPQDEATARAPNESGAVAPRQANDARAGRSGAVPKPSPGTDGQPPPAGPGVVSAASAANAGADDRRESERRAPGGLSRGEATQLLDSVAGELRRLPVAAGGARRRGDDENPIKDW